MQRYTKISQGHVLDLCDGFRVRPVMYSCYADDFDTVKVFCPRCQQIYAPQAHAGTGGKVGVKVGLKMVRTLTEGDFFGEVSLLADQPSSATVQASTFCNCMVLVAASYYEFLERFPHLRTEMEHCREEQLNRYEGISRTQKHLQTLQVAGAQGSPPRHGSGLGRRMSALVRPPGGRSPRGPLWKRTHSVKAATVSA